MLFPWYRELFLLCLKNSYLLFKTQIKVTVAGKPSLTRLVPYSREKVTYLWDVWKQVGLAIQVPHPKRMGLEVSEGSMCELPHALFQSILSAWKAVGPPKFSQVHHRCFQNGLPNPP